MREEILEYNKKFVEEKGYEPYVTSKYPDKKIWKNAELIRSIWIS